MKQTLKLEYFGLLLLSIYLFSITNYAWWWYLVLFFAPDLSMIGYSVNTRLGALCYNIFHHLGLAAITTVLGWHFKIDSMVLAGIVLLGHAAFDRLLGYGLKYSDDFKNTHLGWIGKKP